MDIQEGLTRKEIVEMERIAETKAVKAALIKAGYTGVRVGHARGTGRVWLHIKCNEKPGQTRQKKIADIEKIAQRVTGRTGKNWERINIS